MIPEISEFTYGFALTNELVGWMAMNAAPIFPSLIEEGKQGGGYDVKLDQPGLPLYLQFKRADYMTRSSASEIKTHGLPLSVPFYRFPITQKNKSFQHTSLVELDDGNNLVFYTAPRFHLISEINAAWRAQDVAVRSVFVSPSAIGLIHDNDRHYVSYDASRIYFCSDPIEITALSANGLRDLIESRLSSGGRPVREQLPEWLSNIREKRTGARQTQTIIQEKIENETRATKARRSATTTFDGLSESSRRDLSQRETLQTIVPARVPVRGPPPAPVGPEIRAPKDLSEEELILREISEEALHGFGAQLFVVQPSTE